MEPRKSLTVELDIRPDNLAVEKGVIDAPSDELVATNIKKTESMEIVVTCPFRPSRLNSIVDELKDEELFGPDVHIKPSALRIHHDYDPPSRRTSASGFESSNQESRQGHSSISPQLARHIIVDIPFGRVSSHPHLRASGHGSPRATPFYTRRKMSGPDPYEDTAKNVVDSVIANAKEMVDDVISSAFRRLETRMSEREKTCESLKSDEAPDTPIPRDESYVPQDIYWMTIEEFSLELAEQKINDFIQTWEYENSWLYCVDFLGEDVHKYDKRYRFRVRWSVPTRRKPVPRATASVYFTFVVSTIKPMNYPVDVFYVFETNRLVHKPGHSRFREKWLKDIIESKIAMMSMIEF